jgi:hypothetical protein
MPAHYPFPPNKGRGTNWEDYAKEILQQLYDISVAVTSSASNEPQTTTTSSTTTTTTTA